jgi:hypothetical protein
MKESINNNVIDNIISLTSITVLPNFYLLSFSSLLTVSLVECLGVGVDNPSSGGAEGRCFFASFSWKQ